MGEILNRRNEKLIRREAKRAQARMRKLGLGPNAVARYLNRSQTAVSLAIIQGRPESLARIHELLDRLEKESENKMVITQNQ
jgi:DNA-binding LacI/PurR family transcriptional regulator